MSCLLGTLTRAAPSAALPASPKPEVTQPASPKAEAWDEAPAYLALFVPRMYRAAYRAFTTSASLNAVLSRIGADVEDSAQGPGAWIPHQENPVDAFGMGGTYDRWKLSRLFGSRRPSVARGVRGRGTLVEESWTLISPYPSVDLERLEPGTLLIVLRVP